MKLKNKDYKAYEGRVWRDYLSEENVYNLVAKNTNNIIWLKENGGGNGGEIPADLEERLRKLENDINNKANKSELESVALELENIKKQMENYVTKNELSNYETKAEHKADIDSINNRVIKLDEEKADNEEILWEKIGVDGVTFKDPNGYMNANNSRIQNMAQPTNNNDGATKKYVDDEITKVNTKLENIDSIWIHNPEVQGEVKLKNVNDIVNLHNTHIKGVLRPNFNTDAANKEYVDTFMTMAQTGWIIGEYRYIIDNVGIPVGWVKIQDENIILCTKSNYEEDKLGTVLGNIAITSGTSNEKDLHITIDNMVDNNQTQMAEITFNTRIPNFITTFGLKKFYVDLYQYLPRRYEELRVEKREIMDKLKKRLNIHNEELDKLSKRLEELDYIQI